LHKYSPVVRLDLESRPEAVTLARSTLVAVADALELEPELRDDLRTAVSEACNNVVLHAYGGEPGPLTLVIATEPDGIEVVVQDRGSGIQHVSSPAGRMGLGLAVISALTERVEFSTRPFGGTEVRMFFSAHGGENPSITPDGLVSPPERQADLDGRVVASAVPSWLLRPVLGRLGRAAAAQARFTADGVALLPAATDAIAAYAGHMSPDGHVNFSIDSTTRRLEVIAGPLRGDAGGSTDDQAVSLWTALAPLVETPELEERRGRRFARLTIVDDRVSAS
jgi:anti-sigma regulatory factor (Ser/Thr protein kinase)